MKDSIRGIHVIMDKPLKSEKLTFGYIRKCFNELQISQLPNNYPAAYHPYIYQHHNLVRREAEAEPQSSYNDTYVGYRVGMMGLGSFGFKGIMPYMATPFAVWGRPFG